MVFSFLDKENIFSKYTAAKEYTGKLTDPFPEFERIARNRPKDSIPAEYPKTTDGTASSIIKKSPRRVVQQLPTGKVDAEDNDQYLYLTVIAEFIYLNKIIPYANNEYDLIQKNWNVIEAGLTVGAAAVTTPFLFRDGRFSTDMKLVYWGDLFFQPGKKSGYACDYVFTRDWWQVEDIDSLIDREKKNAQEAKKRGEKYESSWDLEALESVKDAITKKDEDAKTPSEKERSTEVSAIEIVTGHQNGLGAEQIVFNPTEEKVIRVKKNKDPRGRHNVDFFYSDTDGSNPFGRGIIELIGGMQNLLDQEVQMYQYNRALQLNPPLTKWGNFNKAQIKYQPNVIIDMGDDPNAKIEPLNIDSSALSNFANHYSLAKSQIYNLTNANGDSSISSTVGDIQSSKTHAGVQQQQERISIDDNFLRRMFEAFWENWSETAINVYFAERQGKELIQLDKDTADRVRKLIKIGKAPEDVINDRDQVLVDYSEDTPALRFRVDASTSKKQTDQEQADAVATLLERAESSPILQALIPQEKFAAAWNTLVSTSGIEDPENLTIDIDQLLQDQQAAQQQAVVPDEATAGVAEQATQQPLGQHIEAQPQAQEPIPGKTDEDSLIEQELRDYGASEQDIVEAFQLLDEGVSGEEIFAALTGGNNGR